MDSGIGPEELDKAKSGDPEALSVLGENVYSLAYRFLRSCGASREDAEDLAQETVIRFFSNLATIDWPYKSWVFRVARNLFLDLKGLSANKNVSLDDESEDGPAVDVVGSDPGPFENLSAGERYEQLLLCLSSLPYKYRDVIALWCILGLSCEDTAQVTGLSVPTIRTYKTQGLALLAKCLEVPYEKGKQGRRRDRSVNDSGHLQQKGVDHEA